MACFRFGWLAFVLACGDSNDDSGTEVVDVSPTAGIELSSTPLAGVAVELTGAPSYDPNGDPLDLTWFFDHLPAESGLDDSAYSVNGTRTLETTFTPDVLGTYVVGLTVTDNVGNESVPAYKTIYVSEDGAPAIADAGADQSGEVGNAFQLDGSGSVDDLGRSLTYDWAFTKVPEGSVSVLDDKSAQTPSFTADLPGLYKVGLVVDNGVSSSQPDVVDIYVSNPGNVGPDSVIVSDGTVGEDCSWIPLDGSTSSDPDGDPLEYHWTIQEKPVDSAATNADIEDRASPTTSFYPDVAGSYVFSLAVFDGVSWDISLATIQAVDRSYNSAPVVDAGKDYVVKAGTAECEQVAFEVYECDPCIDVLATLGEDASIGDPDGDGVSYNWSVVSGDATLNVDDELVVEATLENAAPVGPYQCSDTEYTFRLEATDCPLDTTEDLVTVGVRCCGVP